MKSFQLSNNVLNTFIMYLKGGYFAAVANFDAVDVVE